MESNNKLLELLKQENFDLVVEFLQAQKTDLKETFEILNKAESVTFWNVVLSNVRSLMPVVSQLCNESTSNDDSKLEAHLVTLKCILNAMSAFCLVSKFKPPALFDIVLHSQNVLMCNKNVPSLQNVKNSVSKLSELWWLNNEEGAENLMPQLITYLLMQTLGIDGHDVDIKRLYALRGGFLLLDLEDNSSSFVRELIQRSFVHPSYLKVKEGQKLLAFLLNINQGLLIDMVAAVIKPQLATGTKTVTGAYGRIFYQAWIESQAQKDEEEATGGDGNVQASAQALEDTVQNFLREGIHASEDKYFKGVRFMLQALHDVQRTKLDAMLLRVYDPILWRSLRCANAQVRAQAAVVFLDVFPLQHADGRAEDNDKILQKQFDLLAALLTDTDQHVRAHAALGVCHILKEYWESLPLNTTHNILKFLIDTLSVDSSCANVRHSVFVGLGVLFQQPLTHTLLKQLLPLLRNSIHDKSEKVRVAFMKILCQVKGIRGMHFYDIVPVDHLLARMAADRNCPAVSLVMTELLLNSFFPQSEAGATSPETEQLNRCLQFIAKEPVAAEVFYAHLHHFISIGQVAKLVTVMFTFLVTAEARSRAAAAGEGEGNEEETAGGKRRRNPKVAQMQLGFAEKLGLMRLVLRLLESVSDELAVQHLSRDLVTKYLTEEHARSLLASSAACDSTQAVHLLPVAVKLVAFAVSLRKMGSAATGKTAQRGRQQQQVVAGESAMQELLTSVYLPAWIGAGALEQNKQEMARSALASAFVEVFRSDNQEETLLVAVLAAFEAECGVQINPVGKKGSSKKLAAAKDSAAISFGAAVDLLAAFGAQHFSDANTFKIAQCIFGLARTRVEAVLQQGGDNSDEQTSAQLLRVLQVWISASLYRDAQLALLQEAPDAAEGATDDSRFPLVQDLMAWASDKLVPRLCAPSEKQNVFACRLLGMVLAMLSDLFYLDLHGEEVCLTLRDWLREVHSRGKEFPAAFSRDSSVLLPSLLRITLLLSLGKDRAVFHVEELSVAILDVLLLRVDCAATEDEREATAVLSTLNAVSVAEAAVHASLVRLVDELEALQQSAASKSKKSAALSVDTPRSSSGKMLAAHLLEGTAETAQVKRVHRLLSAWTGDPTAAPFSVRNPLEKVSQTVTKMLLQQLESVHALDAVAQSGSKRAHAAAVSRSENRLDDGNISNTAATPDVVSPSWVQI